MSHAPSSDAAVGTGSADVPEVRRLRDEELARGGWLRRFTGAPPRLLETCELYDSLGFEVQLDPVLPGELEAECAGCSLALSLFKVVYTRPRAAERS